MELCTKEKERRLSAKKPLFPNRRSAIISIAAIFLMICFGLFAIDRNNVNRLTNYQQKAMIQYETVQALVEKRIAYAKTLVGQLEPDQVSPTLKDALSLSALDVQPARLSAGYIALDRALEVLQKAVFTTAQYPVLAPYFDAMYAVEQELENPVNQYNALCEYFNQQKQAFPARWAAERLGFADLELIAIAPALKGRP